MRGLSATTLLNAWETGVAQPLPERFLSFLEAAYPGESRDELARLPIGERDSRLLDLRESTFGTQLESVVACPACSETLEFCLSVSDVSIPREDDSPEPLAVRSGGYEVRFRVPNTDDLIAVESCADEVGARRLLLERCLVEARYGEDEDALTLDQLPEDVVAAMVKSMERADPQTRVELSLTCPECQHQWQSSFDIALYLWTETEDWARRTLREVDALAAAYGWGEAEILALSARRRQLYLELIGR